MNQRLSSMLALLACHARRELLRGPLGLPVTLRHRVLVQRLTFSTVKGGRLWRRLGALRIDASTRKWLFRVLYNAPFGPGDAAAPGPVFRRHRALVRQLQHI
jgi:hypothetical protein